MSNHPEPPTAGVSLSKSAWLIERSQPEGQDPPYWLSLNGWTPVASEAVQFATKDDAERKLDGISGIVGVHSPMGHVVEHVFVETEPPTDYTPMALDSLRDLVEQNVALRAENERLRGLLERALGYTRCTPTCAGYDDALACKCGQVQLDDEIFEAVLNNAHENRDGTSAE